MNVFSRILISLTPLLLMAPAALGQETSAVVLMYHRFGEEKFPSTNTTLAQLDAHIAYLQDNDYKVVGLPEVVAALKSRTPLPPRTVAITIDDAYTSVVSEAWPRFKRAGFAFTVFVATEAVDKKYEDIMSWNDVRALTRDGVTIGGHSHAHPHFPGLSAAQVRADLAVMATRFQAELGHVPNLFAYPYGEAGREDMTIIRDAGFIAAFGQNSGPVYADADPYVLSRFALNETYGALDRFKLIIATKPLRAVNITPADPVLRDNPPQMGFEVLDAPSALAGMSCFGPRGERLDVVADGERITLSPQNAFPTGRARVNCTLKVKQDWYWFGQEFLAGGASEGVGVHERYKN
jgi:poly-beta-1,6-N-acetyl-D-glucosamine N-deacetylase